MTFVFSLLRSTPGSVFTAHKKVHLWSSGIHCLPLIKIFSRTSTLIVVRVQFAMCVFALHAHGVDNTGQILNDIHAG